MHPAFATLALVAAVVVIGPPVAAPVADFSTAETFGGEPLLADDAVPVAAVVLLDDPDPGGEASLVEVRATTDLIYLDSVLRHPGHVAVLDTSPMS